MGGAAFTKLRCFGRGGRPWQIAWGLPGKASIAASSALFVSTRGQRRHDAWLWSMVPLRRRGGGGLCRSSSAAWGACGCWGPRAQRGRPGGAAPPSDWDHPQDPAQGQPRAAGGWARACKGGRGRGGCKSGLPLPGAMLKQRG